MFTVIKHCSELIPNNNAGLKQDLDLSVRSYIGFRIFG